MTQVPIEFIRTLSQAVSGLNQQSRLNTYPPRTDPGKLSAEEGGDHRYKE
jgi:hypothetical protein